MRLFVACPSCDRRYNASNTSVGTRFRCHCGELLTVPEPKGHEASVIRCSSCGGAREKGRNRCGYCGADFTIHERDLNTVCPKCLARVSDQSRFCQHCGAAMAGEQIVEHTSGLTCPVCGDKYRLSHRRLGHEKVSVLECPFCAGLWLGLDSFERLRERVAGQPARGGLLRKARPASARLRKHVGPFYRCCIYCGKHMTRQQYARGSGVVIDICRNHGIWFDAQELQQTLAWITRGETSSKNRILERNSGRAAPRKPPVRQPRPAAEKASEGPTPAPDFLDDVLSGLFCLFD